MEKVNKSVVDGKRRRKRISKMNSSALLEVQRDIVELQLARLELKRRREWLRLQKQIHKRDSFKHYVV